MSYFTKSYLQFLSELSVNNERDWFNANKKRFKEDVEKPFIAFIADLIDQVSAVDPKIVLTPKDAIFRIYKDVRFSDTARQFNQSMYAAFYGSSTFGGIL